MQQQTLKNEIKFEGVGVHLGLLSKVVLHPAPINSGIVFINPKISNEKICIGKIIPEQAIHASVIKNAKLVISTIEHLMAAVSSFHIDNLIIEMEGIEVPILDGSSLSFVNAIEQVGLRKQNAKKMFLTPCKALIFTNNKEDRSIQIFPAKFDNKTDLYDKNLYFDYEADFKHPLVGKSRLNGKLSLEFFNKQIAPARTFGFLEQLPFLRERGLAKGTTLGNTVVIGEEEFLNERRFNNEFVRHKFLDLLGDLALLGKNLAGTIKAKKTGHNFNRLVISDYIQHPDNWKLI